MPRVAPLPLLFALLVAAPAAATVYVLPTDASMVERSPVIVFGEVRSALPAFGADRPSTDYAVEVEDVLKGFVPGGTILVRQPGGVGPDGVAMRILGLPMLAEGDRVLLFLEPTDGVYRPVEFGLGLFFEVRAGDRVLLAGEPNRRPRDADRFRRWIADRAAGTDRPADYFEADGPAGPLGIAEPFRLTRSPPSCFHDGLALRWREFDRERSVGVTVQASGQPGVPSGGLTEVRGAISAWNDDPASRANLVLRGTLDTEFRTDEVDGVNSISYEDPFDEIPGSYRHGQGGTIAITYTFFHCHSGITPHEVPGNEDLEALAIVEANVTTQDGYREWLRATSNPRKAHEEIMGHELGHVLGISHPCGDSASGACDSVTVQALMRAYAHGDGRGAALNSDDRAAVRELYPLADPFAPPAGRGFTQCRPRTTPLVFEGGYEVRMCYETPAGEIGEAKSGIWASSESGLLWFFSRGNAEVLIKVLDGCRFNGHRWVFVAPVTDVAFNLYVTGGGDRTWSHHNRQGETASARSDTFAFRCQ
ncbi:MAG: hypothetical protein OXG81_00615 [Acidobacteria bacterium]|nr:hypothetical protein [Acidobacteriota bacterium]